MELYPEAEFNSKLKQAARLWRARVTQKTLLLTQKTLPLLPEGEGGLVWVCLVGGRGRNEEVAEGVFKHTKSTRWPCLATARRLRRMVLVPQEDEEEEEEREEGTSERCFSQEEEGAIV